MKLKSSFTTQKFKRLAPKTKAQEGRSININLSSSVEKLSETSIHQLARDTNLITYKSVIRTRKIGEKKELLDGWSESLIWVGSSE